MRAKIFIDANVLIYAHDLDAGTKHARAKSLLAHLWQQGSGVLSTQVLQEFYFTLSCISGTPSLSALQALPRQKSS